MPCFGWTGMAEKNNRFARKHKPTTKRSDNTNFLRCENKFYSRETSHENKTHTQKHKLLMASCM